MPRGSRHDETGLLFEDSGWPGLCLQRDAGGVWRLDVGAAAWRLVGRRVRLTGTRTGFDILDVDRIEPDLPGSR